MIICATQIYQYDYETGQVIFTLTLTTPPYSTFLQGQFPNQGRLIVYEDFGNLGHKYQVFNFSAQYTPTTNSCDYSYNLTGGVCVKDPNCPPFILP